MATAMEHQFWSVYNSLCANADVESEGSQVAVVPTAESLSSSQFSFDHHAIKQQLLTPEPDAYQTEQTPKRRKKTRKLKPLNSKKGLPLLDALPIFDTPPATPHGDSRKRKIEAEFASAMSNPSPVETAAVVVDNPYETSHMIFDARMVEIQPDCKLKFDKGFKTHPDITNTMLCYKKNQFQLTVDLNFGSEPTFLATPTGMRKIEGMFVVVKAVRSEEPAETIGIQQSLADRTKVQFVPAVVPAGLRNCLTLARLHFSETTGNNMRVGGCSNPDQRFFQLIVTIVASCDGRFYNIISKISNNIVVRASNPKSFDQPMKERSSWRNIKPNSTSGHSGVWHDGPVGFNTSSPSEAVTVQGNIWMTGSMLQPADARIRTKIRSPPLNSLRRLRSLKLCEYRHSKEFADTIGESATDAKLGIIAQDAIDAMPEVVKNGGCIDLSSGAKIKNVLSIDKDRLLMETICSLQEMASLVESLSNRLSDAEQQLQIRSSEAPPMANLPESC